VADAPTAAVPRASDGVRPAATPCRARAASGASRAQRLGLGRAPALRARVTSPRRSSTEDSAHDEARAHNVRHERQTQAREASLWLSARWSGYAQPNDEASASAGRPRTSSASLPANSKGGRAAVADAPTAAVPRASNDVRLAATHCRSRPASRASRAQRLDLGRAPALRARVTSPRRSSTEDSAHDEARAHNVI